MESSQEIRNNYYLNLKVILKSHQVGILAVKVIVKISPVQNL